MISQWIHRISDTQRPYRKWKIPSDNSKPRKDGKTLEEFCSAFIKKDSKKIEQIFGDYLWNTISIRDTAVAKENFIKYGIACYKKFSKVVIGE